MLEDENEVLGKTTIDFLQEKTVSLYYLLKIARKAKDKAFRANDNEKYQLLIKKIYVLENLIYEREGFFSEICARLYSKEKAKRSDRVRKVFKGKSKVLNEWLIKSVSLKQKTEDQILTFKGFGLLCML